MEAALTALRTAGVILVVVAVLFGVYIHQVAGITASAAALAAAHAAAESLDETGWDCADSGADWRTAHEAAALAAVERTAASSAATAADYSLAAEADCTVVASVTVAAAGVRTWLQATAAACASTRAATERGWSLDPVC